MKGFAKGVVKSRFLILLIGLVLLIPSGIGYLKTRINYDILTYLPKEIETMKGQDILKDEFGTGAYSMLVVEGMDEKDSVKLKQKIEKVDHVADVLWYDSLIDITVPKEMIPDDVKELAVPVLAHRILIRGIGYQNNSETFLRSLLDQVAAPTESAV